MFKCYLDMDNVLVDTHRGIVERFGIKDEVFDQLPRPWPWHFTSTILQADPKRFWQELPADWWADLHWTVEGKRVVELARQRFGEESLWLLTNPSESPAAVSGKYAWIRREMPWIIKRTYMGADKGAGISGDGKLLVDDAEHNFEDWEAHGGHAVLMPRPWNRLHDLDPMTHIEGKLGLL